MKYVARPESEYVFYENQENYFRAADIILSEIEANMNNVNSPDLKRQIKKIYKTVAYRNIAHLPKKVQARYLKTIKEVQSKVKKLIETSDN